MIWILPAAVLGYVGYRLISSVKKVSLPVIQIKGPGSQIVAMKPGQIFQVLLPKDATWNNPPIVSSSPSLHVVSQGLAKPLIGHYDGKGGTLTTAWTSYVKAPGNVGSTIAKSIVIFR